MEESRTWTLPEGMAELDGLVTGATLAALAEQRAEVCVLTADGRWPTRVESFAERFPSRFFEFGIAERSMVSAAAGLASVGLIPYVTGYAPFMSLMCVEQLRNDAAYPGLPVRIVASNAGLATGSYGPSHHAPEDLAIIASVPGVTVLSLADGESLKAALVHTVDEPDPVYFRVGNGREAPVYRRSPSDWRVGGSTELRAGSDVALLATGACVAAALEAADSLRGEEGISCHVQDMYSIKPLDVESVDRVARSVRHVVTVEEHVGHGGLGAAVARHLAARPREATLTAVAIPDAFAPVGSRQELHAMYGLDADGLCRTVRSLVAEPPD